MPLRTATNAVQRFSDNGNLWRQWKNREIRTKLSFVRTFVTVALVFVKHPPGLTVQLFSYHAKQVVIEMGLLVVYDLGQYDSSKENTGIFWYSLRGLLIL